MAVITTNNMGMSMDMGTDMGTVMIMAAIMSMKRKKTHRMEVMAMRSTVSMIKMMRMHINNLLCMIV